MRNPNTRALSQATGLALVATLVTGCSGSGGLTAWGETITVGEGGTVTTTSSGSSSLLANETGGSDALRLDTTPVEAPAHGTLELATDGTFRYTHDGTESASDRFVYAVVDGGVRLTATVTVTVDPTDDPPVAGDDVYGNAVGNTFLDVGHGTGSAPAVRWEGSVLLNDSDPDGSLQVVAFDEASVMGGVVSMRPEGTFTYLPAVGFQGTDQFTYEVSDGRDSATGTVSITVTGQVWYLDNARSSAGDGRSGRPFRSIDEMGNAAIGGDPIYVSGGSDPYPGTIQLVADQILAGAGSEFRHLGLEVPATRAPVLTATSGSAVEMAPGSTVQGVTIGNTESYGIIGDQPGTATVREVTVEGDGAALHFDGMDLDVELLSVTSIDSAEHGILLQDCTGRFAVRRDVTITNPNQRGIQISNASVRDLEFTVDGSTAIVGPTADGLWISNVGGTVSFGDVDVTGRSDYGIRIGASTAEVTFGRITIPNANDAEGDAIQFAQCGGNVQVVSPDVTGVRSAASPGTASAVFFDSCLEDFVFVVAGDGPQQDGGTIGDVEGTGITVTGRGTFTIARVTFDGCHQSAIGVGSGTTGLTVRDCSFANWGAEADVPALAFSGLDLPATFQMTRCVFDGTGVVGNAPVAQIESGNTGAVEATVGGLAASGTEDDGCTFRNCATAAVSAESLGGLLTVTVGSSIWSDVVGTPTGVLLRGRHDRPLSGRISENTFGGPLAPAVEIAASGGSVGTDEVRVTVSGNTGTALGFLGDVAVSTGGIARVRFASNTVTGMTTGGVVANVDDASQLDLEFAGNSWTFDGNATPTMAAYEFAVEGDARLGILGDSVVGFASATIPTVRMASTTGVGQRVSLYAVENGLGAPVGGAMTATQSAGGALLVRTTGHTAGVFGLVQVAGTLEHENSTGFATDNPGASLSVQGVIDNVPPGSCPLPQGPYF